VPSIARENTSAGATVAGVKDTPYYRTSRSKPRRQPAARRSTNCGVTVLSCVPTLLSMLTEDVPTLRLLICLCRKGIDGNRKLKPTT